MDVSAIKIVRSLPDFKDEITSIVPNFVPVTLMSIHAATRLATSGYNYGSEWKPLKVLKEKSIHISVFVTVEFLNLEVINFLKQILLSFLQRLLTTLDCTDLWDL